MELRINNYCKIATLIIIVLSLSIQSCAPIFSEVQSARTVGKNNFEVTPAFSTVNFAYEGDREAIQKQFGLHMAYGITDDVDLRLRYENVLGEEINVLAIGPKINIVENMVSIYLPIGSYIGDEMSIEMVQFHPTLLLTQPIVENKIDFTAAPKLLIPFSNEIETLFALNFNLALSNDLNRWAIRPEYGFLFNPGEKGYYGQFSIALSLNFGNK